MGSRWLQICCSPNGTTIPWKENHPHDGRVGDEWTTVDDDPRDPAFYSTVWMKDGTHTFDGPQCGTDCTPPDPPPLWRIGDKCIACECVPQSLERLPVRTLHCLCFSHFDALCAEQPLPPQSE